jgi:hypothetical protein
MNGLHSAKRTSRYLTTYKPHYVFQLYSKVAVCIVRQSQYEIKEARQYNINDTGQGSDDTLEVVFAFVRKYCTAFDDGRETVSKRPFEKGDASESIVQ